MRCGVLGSPVAHSLSPVLHRAAYGALSLDWEYDAYDVTEDRLPAFFESLNARWRGLSLTMPLKRAVIDLCDEVDDLAGLLSSANTVVIADGRRRGFNTDVHGFVAAFHEHGVDAIGSALILGGGATAASAMAAVRQLGAWRATVAARSPERASPLLEVGAELGLTTAVIDLAEIDRAPAATVIVSTIPADAQGPLVETLVSRAPTVFDVVYHPSRTALIEAADAAGLTAIGGFDLLLHQAARQVELMTGADEAPLAAMRAAGLAALAGNR
jgi:shikimate dehydrogenase